MAPCRRVACTKPGARIAVHLDEIAYFRGLSPADLQWLDRALIWQHYGAHTSVIEEGEPCQGFYALAEGRARIYTTARSGRQQVLAILQPRDTFNEVPVFDGGPNPASVATLEASTVVAVPRETALALIGRSPQAALSLLAAFAGRLRGFTSLVQALAFDDFTHRLARFLALLARNEGRPSPEGIVIPRSVTMQELAAMVGSVREVVTRSLGHLEAEGLLRVQRETFTVPQLQALERFSSE